MTSVLELARLSAAVYDGAALPGWSCAEFRAAWKGLLDEGMQAGLYTRGSERVIAFRGTNISLRILGAAQDLVADLVLGFGMNSQYFAAAQRFVANNGGVTSNLVLCGHSLGGAIAQVVGNRLGARFATFNAPGVAVWASRNFSDANPVATGVRTVGMLASAMLDPVQAAQDIGAAFVPARGLNVRTDLDRVSGIGVHYGAVETIQSLYRGFNPLQRHGIDNVVASLLTGDGKRIADRDSATFA